MDIAPGRASAILRAEETVMRVGIPACVFVALAAAIALLGEDWSRARITALPDSAFAVVEVAPDGAKLRHLPHHDEQGEVDLPHLRAALSRIGQVRWLHPESEIAARRHLEEHLTALRSQP